MKQEQQAIDAQYEKKRKGAEVAQKMYTLIPQYLLAAADVRLEHNRPSRTSRGCGSFNNARSTCRTSSPLRASS